MVAAVMPTLFTKGDIFQTDGLRAYAHGCDCAGGMDVGIAVAFKKRWPAMYEDYRARCAARSFHLGDVHVWTAGDETVYSLGIQERSDSKAKASALSKAVTTMVELAHKAGVERIGLPRIGAGRAGIDWPRIKKILTEVGQQTSVTLLVFEQFIRTPEAASGNEG
jgi:O-acetyl-ADP-ribose deacetylase (regulator of RNase III)